MSTISLPQPPSQKNSQKNSLALSDQQFAKLAAFVSGLVPLSLLGWDAWHGALGANPVNYAIRTTGLLALISLLLTLAVTPLTRLFGWQQLTPFRRLLGLYAFTYAAIHFLIYAVYDRDLSLGSTFHEIVMRVYLQVGIAALLLMVPLAVTSTNTMIRRLGPGRWKLLHRLTYLVAIAGVAHYYLLVKADTRGPLAFAAVLAGLLLYRAVDHYLKLRRFYAQAKNSPAAAAAAATAPPSARAKNWTGELKVALLTQETPLVRTLRLVNPAGGPLPFDYLPGQFLTLSLTIEGKPIKRPYTIASSPSRNAYCELTIKREEQGLVSRFIHDQIRQGDTLRAMAPGGRFTFAGNDAESLVLIGGGVGITPLMSKIRYLTDRAWDGEIYLIYSARTAADLIFREELEYLAKRHPNLHVCQTLSQSTTLSHKTKEQWQGEQGRITMELLHRYVPNLGQAPIHICGPAEFNKHIKQMLLEAGIKTEQIQLESFGPAQRKAASATPVAVVEPANTDGAALANDLYEIHFARADKSRAISAETTILDAAEKSGVRIDSDCRAGVCGTCKVRLLRGNIQMDNQEALEPSDLAAGRILACQARCLEDVAIDA